MTGRNPTAAETAQRETTAAAGIALRELARSLGGGVGGDVAGTITWRPMTEHPKGSASAMIRATDHEGSHLLPGPVAWSRAQACWVDESSDLPIGMTQPGAVYHWCDETEIVGAGNTAQAVAP